MATKTVTGKVFVNGVEIGSVNGSYDDEYIDQSTEQINTKSITAIVYLDSVQIGNGSGSYEDKISYNEGGTETKTVSGNVLIDSVQIGTVSGTLEDQYGAVTGAKIPTQLTLEIVPL